MRAKQVIVGGLVAAVSLGLWSTPAKADVLERTFGISGGISIFDHTCNPRPNNTVWVNLSGRHNGNDNWVNYVEYKNFSGTAFVIYHGNVGANGQYVYWGSTDLGPNSTVRIQVNRSFPGKMTVVADAVRPRDWSLNQCGGNAGNKHVFSRP
ncbi:hypothetical protein [Nonomuraea sp. NPDC050643]|uniref:hypothetical protein n=1 Tax=Nonomuraea sp. NPDC050643 TaxID=3155660 RepID=UPI0033D974F5